MENQEAKSKWDDLARELGAEIAPEATHPTVSSAPESERQLDETAEPKRESRAKTPAPIKRSATDWSALNSELGLEPPPVAEPPAAKAQPQLSVEPAPDGGTGKPRREERSRSADRPSRSREDRPQRDQEQPRSAERPRSDRSRPRSREESRSRDDTRSREDVRARDETRSREESLDRGEAGSRDDSRSRGESRSVDRLPNSRRGRNRRRDEREDDAAAKSDAEDMIKAARREAEADEASSQEMLAEREPEPQKASSVSLWHKIFGLPTEQTAKMSSTERDVSEPREVAESEAPVTEATWTGFTETDEGTLDFEARSDEVEEHREGDPDDRRRRRPRRRRRGGRKATEQRDGVREERKPAQRRDRDADVLEDTDDDFGFDDEFGGAPVRTTDSARPEFDLDDEDEDFEDDEERGKASASAKSAGHRGIPSWQEAIGAIVDLNLQSRSQRRQTSQAHGRSGAQRGRPRGRRKKKA